VQIPGYQLGNFLLCSLMYIAVSHRLFDLTNTLKNSLVPHSDNVLLARNAILMAACMGALYTVAATIHMFVYQV
jgi:N-acetylneuraminate 9-O-acetyltransferase